MTGSICFFSAELCGLLPLAQRKNSSIFKAAKQYIGNLKNVGRQYGGCLAEMLFFFRLPGLQMIVIPQSYNTKDLFVS